MDWQKYLILGLTAIGIIWAISVIAVDNDQDRVDTAAKPAVTPEKNARQAANENIQYKANINPWAEMDETGRTVEEFAFEVYQPFLAISEGIARFAAQRKDRKGPVHYYEVTEFDLEPTVDNRISRANPLNDVDHKVVIEALGKEFRFHNGRHWSNWRDWNLASHPKLDLVIIRKNGEFETIEQKNPYTFYYWEPEG